MRRTTGVCVAAAVLAACLARPGEVAAQQRPLLTEDAETVGAGRLLIEAGLDVMRDVSFPVSGLVGDLVAVPLGISIGVSSIAEIQLDGGFYRRLAITERLAGPLAGALDVSGNSTTSIDDLTIGTKVRFVGEAPGRPAVGIRLATKLPNASNEAGLGHDTTDFFAAALVAKTTGPVRLAANGGVAILSDPTRAARQDDLLTYGVSIARAMNQATELVGEINGRLNLAEGDPTPGAENRAVIRVGARYTRRTVRLDGALLIGATSLDPAVGFTAGLTWVLDAFRLP